VVLGSANNVCKSSLLGLLNEVRKFELQTKFENSTSTYKFEFEFGLEAITIRFVATDSGVYLTSGAINVIVHESGQWTMT